MKRFKFSDSNGKRFVIHADKLSEAKNKAKNRTTAKTVYFEKYL